MVKRFICLGPQGMDSISLPRVQHAHLDAGFVRADSHLAAQGVYLPYQLSLSAAAYGRVTGHKGNIIQGKRRQQRFIT